MTADQSLMRTAIPLVRCSTSAQAENSTDDQLRIIQQYAIRNPIRLLDPVRLEGMSGADSFGMDAVIEVLIERRRTKRDFDAIIVQDLSRLTRSGPTHAAHLQYILSVAGIDLLLANGESNDPRVAGILTAVHAQSANDQIRTSAFNIARGLASSVAERRKAHCGKPPFAIDREYLDGEGRPAYIIRNQPDGSQVRLSADGREEVLARYGKNPSKGAKVHHVRQKTERVVLIPGERGRVQTVGRIYELFLVEKQTLAQIVDVLKAEQRPSPTGQPWQRSTVWNLLNNPIYGGIAISFRSSMSKFYRAGTNGPVAASGDADLRTLSGTPSVIRRPASDWVRWQEEGLSGFLPEPVRGLAAEFHEGLLAAQAAGHRPTPRRDPAPHSEFLLKGILTSKQGGLPMTGTISGRDSQYRHYRVAPRTAPSEKGSSLRRRIPAGAIETEVLGHVRGVLLADPTLERTIADALGAEYRQIETRGQGRAELLREQDQIAEQIASLMAGEKTWGRSVMEAGLSKLGPRLEQIKRELSATVEVPRRTPEQIREEARRVVAELRSKTEAFDALPRPMLRDLIASLFSSLTIDLETCELNMEMRLPDWAMTKTAMGLLSNALYPSGQRTHRFPLLLSASHVWADGPCCRRRRVAA